MKTNLVADKVLGGALVNMERECERMRIKEYFQKYLNDWMKTIFTCDKHILLRPTKHQRGTYQCGTQVSSSIT